MNDTGKVKINDRYYSGRDCYSDGDIEDLLLAAAMDGRNYQEVMMEHPSWPVFYHLSDMRENVLNWIPFQKTDSVLEIGAGCGAVTGVLLERCKEVVCVELSKKRSLINAYRHKNAQNLEIIVGCFADVRDSLDKKFDYITLIGVYEYAALYTKEEHSHQVFLRQLKKLLKPGGRLIIAIENRLGLKYFAGCREDHLGTCYQGIENQYPKGGVRTFSRTELIELLERAGLGDYQFYYPYPDYKLPETIYSDDYLPKKGTLVQNIRNFDADRLVLFDESKAWDGILDAGLFAEFSNSFLVMASVRNAKKNQCSQATMPAENQSDKIIFAKFASERAAAYQIVTKIIKHGCSQNSCVQIQNYVVQKKALTDKAKAHIHKMQESYAKLSEVFGRTRIRVAECVQKGEDSIEMPFMRGKDLECLLEEYITQERQEQAAGLVKYFLKQFLEQAKLISFQKTEAFAEVFGKVDGRRMHQSLPVTNADCIFSNFLVKESRSEHGEKQQEVKEFVMLDYEWTFYFPIPIKFVLFRAFFHSYAFQKLEQKYQKMLFQYAGIEEEDKPFYLNMEFAFQQYVRGKKPETEKIYQSMHTHAWDIRRIDPKAVYTEYQIYFDGRLGKWKDTLEREVTIHTLIPEGTEMIRIVLNDKNGVYKLCSIRAEDGRGEIEDYKSNAQLQISDDFYFTQKPEIQIENRQYHEIILKYQILEAGSNCMEQMITALKNAEYYRQAYCTAKQNAQAYEQAYLASEESVQSMSRTVEECREQCRSLEEERKQIQNSLLWKLGSKIGSFKN